MEDKAGYRIWEIDEKTKVPKEFLKGSMEDLKNLIHHNGFLESMNLKNKTYAIRIGKRGLE